jgi:hypothetical protein
METIVQHASVRSRVLRRGPAVAGLALAIPLGMGAGTAVPRTLPAVPRTLPARPAAAVVPGQPAVGEQAQATIPPARDLPAPRLAFHGGSALPAHGGAPGAACNGSLPTATLMPFSEHMNHAHFGRSPEQQASDIEDADTYTRTHTVLVQNMSQPGRDDLFAISDGSMVPLVEHLDHAHFERSPMQQADDVEHADSYVKQHTVLVEHMVQPVLVAVSGDC